MSIVNTETLQADTLVAKDGTDTTEVSIPSLQRKIVYAMCNFDGLTTSIRKSVNISSFTKQSAGIYYFSIITPAPTNDYIITGSASGGKYFLSPEDYSVISVSTIPIQVVRGNTEKNTDRDNCSLVIYYTDSSPA